MSEHVTGLNRDQTALFPDTLEGYVDKDNPVRFIDAFIDSLNLENLGFKHAQPIDVGRPSCERCLFKMVPLNQLCRRFSHSNYRIKNQ